MGNKGKFKGVLLKKNKEERRRKISRNSTLSPILNFFYLLCLSKHSILILSSPILATKTTLRICLVEIWKHVLWK